MWLSLQPYRCDFLATGIADVEDDQFVWCINAMNGAHRDIHKSDSWVVRILDILFMARVLRDI
jgi:hypothetical protein